MKAPSSNRQKQGEGPGCNLTSCEETSCEGDERYANVGEPADLCLKQQSAHVLIENAQRLHKELNLQHPASNNTNKNEFCYAG